MQQIQNIIKASLQQMQGLSLDSNQLQQFEDEEYQIQCRICMSPFSRTNHPMKVCLKDHNMCQKCVEQKLFREITSTFRGTQTTRIYCPFCEHPIKLSKIVVNYKLLCLIKNVQNNQKSSKQNDIQIDSNSRISLFQKLSQQNYRLIMSFVSQIDKMHLSSTNLFLRSFLMTDQIWGTFNISDCIDMNLFSQNHPENWNLRLKWISKYFSVIKPHQVKIIIRDVYGDVNLLQFFYDQYNWVTKLTLVCENQNVHLTIAKACKEVNFLSVGSYCFSDVLFEYMAALMKKIKRFQVIKDDGNFTARNISKYFSQGLESILLKPHMVEFEQIALLAKDNPQTLTQIELDVQNCPEQTLIEILQPLTNVQVLKLYHMQNINMPQKLTNSLSTSVRQLYLTKAYEMPMTLIINKIATPKLLTIDFTEVNLLDNNDVLTIAKSCPYLKRLNISWCNKVSEESIAKLIRSCLYLQQVNLTGLKSLTEKIFEEYVGFVSVFDEQKYNYLKQNITYLMNKNLKLGPMEDETIEFIKVQSQTELQQRISKIKSLKNLKQLNCVSCNGISDAILKIIYLINRKANTINYYGNCMGLYNNNDLFGSA